METSNKIAIDISRSFLEIHHPDQLSMLDEFVHLSSVGGADKKISPDSRQFGEFELLEPLIAPLILGIVSSYIAGILARKDQNQSNSTAKDETIRDLHTEMTVLKKKVRKRTKRKYKNHNIDIDEIIDFTEEYIEEYIEMSIAEKRKRPSTQMTDTDEDEGI